MNNLVDTVTGWVTGVGSGPLMHALMGLVILIVGMILVKIIVGILGRFLGKISFLKSDAMDLTAPIMALARAVLTIFVLMAVLNHFGLTNVLDPLENMVDQFMGAIPNIVGAGVIAYAGWMIAKVVSQLVGMAMGKVDEQIAERTGNAEIKVSPFASAFIFGGILLPILVAALGVLNIPAISDPASAMINQLLAAVPNIIGAVVIMTVTYFVAKFVTFMLGGLLAGLQFDSLPERIGMDGVFSDSFTPTKAVSGAIIFFSMLAASTAAIQMLGIDILSTIFAKVLEFGGGILMGAVILVVGNYLSILASGAMAKSGAKNLAGVARFAILGLVIAMGLRSMGLADNIVNMAFGLTLGSIAVAAAIAFGIGGRDAAKALADGWAKKLK